MEELRRENVDMFAKQTTYVQFVVFSLLGGLGDLRFSI